MYIDMTKLPRKLNLVPHVLHVGLFTIDRQERNDTPQDLQFCFRLSGSKPLQCRIDGKVQTMRYPHLFIKYPGREIHPANEASFFTFYFAYPGETVNLFHLGGLTETLEYCPFDPREVFPDFPEQFENWDKELYRDGTADRIDMACFQLASAAILAAKMSGAEDPEINRLKRIASELRMTFSQPADFSGLAKREGFSRVRFFRMWKELFGCPPQEWLLNLKFQEAKRLLAEADMSISEISELIGYRESANFCAAFRTRYGITPLKFRKNL